MADAGTHFHQLTRYHRRKSIGRPRSTGGQPGLYKTYGAETRRVLLLPPDREGGLPLYSLLAGRRSVRRYSTEPLAFAHLSQLLWAAQGVSMETQRYSFRTAPSAGALYPIETYVAVNRVEDLEPGVYHYEVLTHRLVLIRPGDIGDRLAGAALGQQMMAQAACTFAFSAVAARSTGKYAERAWRYIYMEAGHITQNLALAAVSLGLATCQVGAFFDDEVEEVLGLDGEKETVLYLTVVGVPAR